MTTAIAPPSHYYSTSQSGKAITLVVPSLVGCNLKCSWCHIKGSQENIIEVNGSNYLSISDYIDFISNINKRKKIDVLSIQGYEPLLDNSWEYTKTILEYAKKINISTSLITNGYNLEKRAEELLGLKVDGITVSLDSYKAEQHNFIRGNNNSFERAIDGIKAVSYSRKKNLITVSSVLLPNKSSSLTKMPQLLKKLGVKLWVVNPLHKIGQKNFGEIVAEKKLYQAVETLLKQAALAGIEMVVDDEFGKIPILHKISEVRTRQLKNPNNLIRLSPNGNIYIGKNIIKNQHQYNWKRDKNYIDRGVSY